LTLHKLVTSDRRLRDKGNTADFLVRRSRVVSVMSDVTSRLTKEITFVYLVLRTFRGVMRGRKIPATQQDNTEFAEYSDLN